MLSLLATAASDSQPIQWVSLGLKSYLFKIGSFELRWYSLAYLAGIILGYWLLNRMNREPGAPMAQRHTDDLFFYCTLGIILGGRLGYATFYTGAGTDKPSMFTNFIPGETVSWELLRLWDGGMSFHGGLIGTVVAIVWVCWRNQLSFLRVCDYVAVVVPFGMLFGRLANFINGELWGRVAGPDVPWAMVFPDAGNVARHPSQLYLAGLEGLLLIAVMLYLFWRTKARWRPGLLVGVFTLGIGLARFTMEYFREPDAQLADFAQRTGFSMGQWLTMPLILIGLGLVGWSLRRPALGSATPSPQ